MVRVRMDTCICHACLHVYMCVYVLRGTARLDCCAYCHDHLQFITLRSGLHPPSPRPPPHPRAGARHRPLSSAAGPERDRIPRPSFPYHQAAWTCEGAEGAKMSCWHCMHGYARAPAHSTCSPRPPLGEAHWAGGASERRGACKVALLLAWCLKAHGHACVHATSSHPPSAMYVQCVLLL